MNDKSSPSSSGCRLAGTAFTKTIDVSPKAALAFVRQQGVVLESARSIIPNLVEAAIGERIRGSWWGHAKGHELFWLTRFVRGSRDVLVCRLIGGKVTYVHRRLWPALVRMAPVLGVENLARLREIHTAQGRHELELTPYPMWVPTSVKRQALKLTAHEAKTLLGLTFRGANADRRLPK